MEDAFFDASVKVMAAEEKGQKCYCFLEKCYIFPSVRKGYT